MDIQSKEFWLTAPAGATHYVEKLHGGSWIKAGGPLGMSRWINGQWVTMATGEAAEIQEMNIVTMKRVSAFDDAGRPRPGVRCHVYDSHTGISGIAMIKAVRGDVCCWHLDGEEDVYESNCKFMQFSPVMGIEDRERWESHNALMMLLADMGEKVNAKNIRRAELAYAAGWRKSR
jgi:hypothetical protein